MSYTFNNTGGTNYGIKTYNQIFAKNRTTAGASNFGAFLQKLCKSVKQKTTSTLPYRDPRLPMDPTAKSHFGPARQPSLVKNGIKRKWLHIDAFYPVLEVDSFNNLNMVKLCLWVSLKYIFV